MEAGHPILISAKPERAGEFGPSGEDGMMPPLEMMISAPDLFMLVISETRLIKTSLISLQVGNCDMCVQHKAGQGVKQPLVGLYSP